MFKMDQEIDKIPTKENKSVEKNGKKEDKNKLVKENSKELPEFKGLE